MEKKVKKTKGFVLVKKNRFLKKKIKKKKECSPGVGEHSKKKKKVCTKKKKNFLIRKLKEKNRILVTFLIALFILFSFLFFDKEFKEKKYINIK